MDSELSNRGLDKSDPQSLSLALKMDSSTHGHDIFGASAGLKSETRPGNSGDS
jgi:hypothetical protein